ncbi:hypothetical protein [Neptunicella marina]|uniref:Uncharacterized protein n=1 Tax=Neptunicella marina TaxID=2125989 RepID=A0A8J6ITQ0_9ALTE|nr:hypothetical protein [Neptunicella marina]MBC3765627.1 hypothetical protein [Neptunicella marina]
MTDILQYKNVTISLRNEGTGYEATLYDDSGQVYLWAADISQATQLAKRVIDNKTELKLALSAACYQINIASCMYADSQSDSPIN